VDSGNPPTADLLTGRRGDILDEGGFNRYNFLLVSGISPLFTREHYWYTVHSREHVNKEKRPIWVETTG